MRPRLAVSIALVLALVGGALVCRSVAPETRAGPLLRIYLARHGQTSWNAERRLQGQSDTELNEAGREQARELGRRIEGLPLDRVYSSDLQRSRVTAEIAAAGRVPVEPLAGLREQALGKFEGLYLDGRDPGGQAEYERRSADPADALDGGESEDQVLARVRTTVDAIRARHPRGSILIVGHGGTNRLVLRALLDLTAEQAAAIRQANDELYAVELAPGPPPRLWKYIGQGNLADL